MGKAEEREEKKLRLDELRERLGTLNTGQWQQAQAVMTQITAITGRRGAMGGLVCPRACKCCKLFGHTSQHCPRKSALLGMEILKHQRDVLRWNALVDPAVRSKSMRQDAVYQLVRREHPTAICKFYHGEGGPCLKCRGCTEWAAAYRDCDGRTDYLVDATFSVGGLVVDVAK